MGLEWLGQRPPRRRMLQLNGFPTLAETPLELLTDYLTPNDLFFVRHHWQPTIPEPGSWRLTVDGAVRRPLVLGLSELKRLPQTTVTCVLQCAGNGRSLHTPPVPGLQWGQGAVGNARWTGVRVRDLLDRAGLDASARHLHTFGTDTPPAQVPPFHRSLPLEKALEDGVIAWEMNGEPLPSLHGGPARLVVAGWAGQHWMKWLSRVSASPLPQTGFYMDIGYRYPRRPGTPGIALRPDEMEPVTELFVKSVFTGPPAQVRVGRSITLRGFAFSGAPDIARVELSDDDGATWRPTALDARHDPYAWRLWRIRWTPERTGRVRWLLRATDSRGATQPRETVWNQSGYLANGWDHAELDVVEHDPAAPAPAEESLPRIGARIGPLPDGPGKSLAERACLSCHSADLLRQQRLTERQWTAAVAKMRGWGAPLSEKDGVDLAGYLARHFGPGSQRFVPEATRPLGR
ncbi:MAG: molybdopterin-dependent oxidoreductase [Gemmatimonadales bacterium]